MSADSVNEKPKHLQAWGLDSAKTSENGSRLPFLYSCVSLELLLEN